MRTPYRDMTEAAEFLRIRDKHTGGWSPRGALEWLDRHKVPTKKRGQAVLVHEDDLQAALKDR